MTTLQASACQVTGKRLAVAVDGDDARGPHVVNGIDQRGPVGMVGHHESSVVTAPSPVAAHPHPARHEARRVLREPPHPGRSGRRRRRQNQLPTEFLALFGLGDHSGRQHRDAGIAVGVDQQPHRAVQPDRLVGAAGQLGEDALRLAQRVAEQHSGPVLPAAALPPLVNFVDHLIRLRPPVDRQTEGAFGQPDIDGRRLERGTGRIRGALEVAGYAPGTGIRFYSHPGRAEDMPSRKQRHPNIAQFERSAPPVAVMRGAFAEACGQDREVFACRVVVAGTRPRVVGVRVRDDRARDRFQGVDPETAGLAVQAAGIRTQQIVPFHGRKFAARRVKIT